MNNRIIINNNIYEKKPWFTDWHINWQLVVDQEKNNSMEGDISNILNVIITSST